MSKTSVVNPAPGVFPAWCYLLPCVPALLNVVFIDRSPWSVPIFSLIVIPIAELIVGRFLKPVTASNKAVMLTWKPLHERPGFRAILVASTLAYTVSLVRTFVYFGEDSSRITFSRLLASGIVGFFAIPPAHEALHKVGSRSWLEQAIGTFLVGSVLSPGYRTAHLHHHTHVGLAEDMASAPLDTNPYVYAFRVEVAQWRIAMAQLRRRIEKERRIPVHDAFFRCLLVSIGQVTLVSTTMGVDVLLANLVICAITALLFQAGGQLQEHAGLGREAGQEVGAHHSWNSTNPVSNLIGFEVGRHSHHHMEATVAYPHLHFVKHAPEMPYGLVTMAMIALCYPPVFWRIVRQSIKEHQQRRVPIIVNRR